MLISEVNKLGKEVGLSKAEKRVDECIIWLIKRLSSHGVAICCIACIAAQLVEAVVSHLDIFVAVHLVHAAALSRSACDRVPF